MPESSIDKVRKQYEGTEQWMKAPNGKPTNLTERQWLTVRMQEFKAWFGDWENDAENASKVVDENGEPRVVYHGTTRAGFLEFDTQGQGKTEGTGAWFSDKNRVAETYSGKDTEAEFLDEEWSNYLSPEDMEGRDPDSVNMDEGPTNYPVFLNIRNPYVHDAGGKN